MEPRVSLHDLIAGIHAYLQDEEVKYEESRLKNFEKAKNGVK